MGIAGIFIKNVFIALSLFLVPQHLFAPVPLMHRNSEHATERMPTMFGHTNELPKAEIFHEASSSQAAKKLHDALLRDLKESPLFKKQQLALGEQMKLEQRDAASIFTPLPPSRLTGVTKEQSNKKASSKKDRHHMVVPLLPVTLKEAEYAAEATLEANEKKASEDSQKKATPTVERPMPQKMKKNKQLSLGNKPSESGNAGASKSSKKARRNSI